jgi:hypothetical protein
MDVGLSFEPVRVREVGGGGKTGFEAGSGDDLYRFVGGARVTGDMLPESSSSLDIIDAR